MSHIRHQKLLRHLKLGLYWGKDTVEFDYDETNDEGYVTLDVYYENGFLAAYNYDCRENAEQDMNIASEEYGICFKPLEDYTASMKHVLQTQLKKVV